MAASSSNGGDSGDSGRSRRRRRLAIIAAATAVEVIPLWRRGYGVGGSVVVRCRDGHLFTTLWVPGASVKALRLGPRRLQWCPVGRHWSLVTIVPNAELSERQRRTAHAHKDIRLP